MGVSPYPPLFTPPSGNVLKEPSMAKPTEKKSIIMVRAKKGLVGPPGIMGFENMFTPDTKFGEPILKVQLAYNDDQQAALAKLLDEKCIDPLWDEFEEEATANGKAGGRTFKKPNGTDYVSDQMKAPHEKAKVQLPTMDFKVKQQFKNKAGEIVSRELAFWDAKGNVLDGPALKMGRGTILQPVFLPALFMNSLIAPQPSLQLQGLRVLKVETWGGGGNNPGAVDDEALSTLGTDFEAEDLSGFLASAKKDVPTTFKKSGSKPADFADDLDDEIPF